MHSQFSFIWNCISCVQEAFRSLENWPQKNESNLLGWANKIWLVYLRIIIFNKISNQAHQVEVLAFHLWTRAAKYLYSQDYSNFWTEKDVYPNITLLLIQSTITRNKAGFTQHYNFRQANQNLAQYFLPQCKKHLCQTVVNSWCSRVSHLCQSNRKQTLSSMVMLVKVNYLFQ